jgi:RNA polymerase sigma factor (sigma-70 family)
VLFRSEEDEDEEVVEDAQQPDLVPDELILQAQHDLRVNKDERARNRVMLAYLPMLRAIVGKYKGVAPFDRQDMLSAGTVAMMQAVTTWAPGMVSKRGKKVKFGQHLRYVIRHAVRDEFNRLHGYTSRRKQKAPIVRLDAPLPGDDSGKARELPGAAPSIEKELAQRENTSNLQRVQQEVRKYISSLPGHEGELLRLRYVEGLTFPEIGERLGIKRSTVEWQLARAKEKMRALLGPKLGDFTMTERDELGGKGNQKPPAD